MSRTSRKKSSFGKLLAGILALGAISYGVNQYNGHGQDPPPAAAKPPAPVKAAPAALHYTDNPRIIKLAHPLPVIVNKENGKTEIKPKGITLHWWSFDSGGNIQGLVKALRGNKACGPVGCTVQFGITKKGEIGQLTRSPVSFAQHAHGANNTTIGIEIEGDKENFALPGKKGFEQKKFEAVVSLVAKLVKKYKIPLDGKVVCDHVVGVHGHSEYNRCGNDKDDVGDAYTKAVKNAVKAMQR